MYRNSFLRNLIPFLKLISRGLSISWLGWFTNASILKINTATDLSVEIPTWEAVKQQGEVLSLLRLIRRIRATELYCNIKISCCQQIAYTLVSNYIQGMLSLLCGQDYYWLVALVSWQIDWLLPSLPTDSVTSRRQPKDLSFGHKQMAYPRFGEQSKVSINNLYAGLKDTRAQPCIGHHWITRTQGKFWRQM